MRTVMDARMKRGHAGLDVVSAEEAAVVIEDELVVVGIAMKEGHLQGIGTLFEGGGRKLQTTAPSVTKVVCALGGRCARWLMIGRMSRMSIVHTAGSRLASPPRPWD
jgi:hypothetical protein